MAKVALTAALLVALVAFATATTYTTTVTTTTLDDESNPGQYQQCQRQLQGKQFRSCQRYMTQGRGPYNGEDVDDDDVVLEMSTENPGQQGQESLRECCQKLRSISPQCQCEAIKHAVRQSGGSYRGEQMQQVYHKAQMLPRHCNLPQQCQIRAIFV